MRYSDPMKLVDLPPEHWARIPPAAYARLLAEPPIEWIKRGDDSTFNERTAAGLDNHCKVLIPWHEFYTTFEWEGSAYHVAPEAVEWLADDGTRQRDMPLFPHIRVCKHCHGGWNRPRGEPLAEAKEGRHDDLYWKGAARNSTACGDDLGRLRHLEEEPYGVETHVSRLEQLALAEVRTHYVSYKIKAYDHDSQRRRLHGHGTPGATRAAATFAIVTCAHLRFPPWQ